MASRGENRSLVAREPALAAVRAALAAADRGGAPLVLVTGEAGMGKTALLRTLATEVTDAGGVVLWGQCWDGDGTPAYWPWVQVLRAGTDAGGQPGEASQLLPENTASWPSAESPGDRFRLFDAVVTFLRGLAVSQRVVVVLDDLQWADDASLHLLEFASRHLSGAPVLLVAAYREEEVDARPRRLAGAREQVVLTGLSRTDVATLMAAVAGDAPPDGVAADVWRRTGGNPFLVRELTRLLVAQGDYMTGATPPARVLDSVRDILGRRLARLSQPCADVLALAAVSGSEVAVEVLARTAGVPDGVAALLDEAVAARVLLEPDRRSGRYRFSHDLFRETIVASLPADALAGRHLAVGRALEARREDGAAVHPAQLAAHFTAAAAAAPVEAVQYGLAAGDDATARLAFEEACGQYERALAALEASAHPDATVRLQLLLRLSGALNRVGHVTAARDAYRDAAELARRLGDAEGLARAAIGTHALGWRTSHAESIALLEEAVAALPATPSALGARARAGLARDLHHAIEGRDWVRAPVLAEQAAAEAREAGDADTLAFSLLALHDARWRPGTAAARLPVVDEMLATAHRADDREMVSQARLLRATALLELGDPRAAPELEAYCRVAQDLRHARARYGALSRRATHAVITGRLLEARELADEAFELGRTIGEPDAQGVHETLLWALKRLGGSWRPASLASDPWPGLPLIEAVLHLASGEVDAARAVLAPLRIEALPRSHDLELLAFAADAVAAVGTPEQAADLYAALLPYAGTHVVVGGCASYFGAADDYLGQLARSLGRLEDARLHHAAAAVMHDRLGAPAWAARSRAEAAGCVPVQRQVSGVFRRDGDVWTVAYQGHETHLRDAKGLHDLAALLARPGEPLQAVELHTGHAPHGGADAVLDATAKAAYRRRLAELDSDLDDAEAAHDLHRAEKSRIEREALLSELSAAVGLGGRDRRLGDERERARKAVAARVRDAVMRIDRVAPDLAAHLHSTVRTGTWCVYTPDEPVHWAL